MDRDLLRRKLIAEIKSFPQKEKESEAIVSMIRSSREWNEADTILAFSPMSSEPDISKLLSDSRVLLPYIENGEMHFSSSKKLSQSAMGFLEPEHVETKYGNALMLVPMLGFNGLWRLGRGGGFYDRYIRENRSRLFTVGVAFSVSHCPDFIPDRHDEKLDMIFSTVV